MYNKVNGERTLAEKLVNYSCNLKRGEKVLLCIVAQKLLIWENIHLPFRHFK